MDTLKRWLTVDKQNLEELLLSLTKIEMAEIIKEFLVGKPELEKQLIFKYGSQRKEEQLEHFKEGVRSVQGDCKKLDRFINQPYQLLEIGAYELAIEMATFLIFELLEDSREESEELIEECFDILEDILEESRELKDKLKEEFASVMEKDIFQKWKETYFKLLDKS